MNSTTPTRQTVFSQGSLLSRLFPLGRGELGVVVWSAAYFFFVLFSFYLMRPIRETMGIKRDWDQLPWLMTGTLGLMLVANPAFSALVARFPRRVFIPLTYHFFALNILVFFVLFRFLPDHGGLGLGYAFYMWLSVFNLFVVSVFWGFVADMFTSEQAKRVFGLIAIGGTLGAISGSFLIGRLTKGIDLPGDYVLKATTPTLLLISIVPLELAVVCIHRLMKMFGIDRHAEAGPASSQTGTPVLKPTLTEPGPGVLAGLRLIVRSPYLLLLCVYMLVFTLGSTFLYMEQGRIVQGAFITDAERQQAFAAVDFWTNVLTLTTQILLTGGLVRLFGLSVALAILPAVSIVGFAVLGAHETFAVLAVVQVARRGLHYAIDRPARESLFTVLGSDEKYKSKSFIDTFVYRTGDMVGGWTPRWLAGASIPLVWVAIPVAALGLLAGIVLGRIHRRMPDPRGVTADAGAR